MDFNSLFLQFMKNIFSLIFAVLPYFNWAQSNLQYNSIKFVSSIQTVPANKVWKIESVLYSSQIPLANTNSTTPFATISDAVVLINNTPITFRSTRTLSSAGYSGGAYYSTWEINLPIWITSGTVIEPSTGVAFISIIEFSDIP